MSYTVFISHQTPSSHTVPIQVPPQAVIMQVLNIAEKPSVAKSISKLMSHSLTTTRGPNKYCMNFKFKFKDDNMIFTSVLGHLFHLNFFKKYKWEEIEPSSLFYEPVVRKVSDETIRKNIENQVRHADKVIIWTDCDREGENIAKQIETVVLGVKSVDVYRARFSGISFFEIQKSYDNLKSINTAEADAVDARMELDLKIGSAFTIFQTLCLKNLFSVKKIVSFGPCQIPTLGFVVERYEAIEGHIEEKYWTLRLHHNKHTGERSKDIMHENKPNENKLNENTFIWKRDRVFDYNCAIHFFNLLNNKPKTITKIEEKPTTKLKPLPLRTVELQKICSSIFKVSAHKIMEIAEKLYNQGFISYPRTETDSFDDKFNFKNILENLKKDGGNVMDYNDVRDYNDVVDNDTSHKNNDTIVRNNTFNNPYFEHCEKIEKNFKYPRKGKNNDMAHSPIYPLKGGSSLSGLEKSIHDFITRRFLGGLCDDAKGLETYYEITIGREVFYTKAHKILKKNYLDVYTYDNWPEKDVSNYFLGEQIKGTLKIEEHRTEPPSFLTESDLISLMDKNGIGTDATIHEHIQKIQEREYARKEGPFIIPEKFGIGLIRAYKELSLDFSGPVLRKDLEIKLKEVCSSKLNKNQLVNGEIRTYHKLYDILKNNQKRFYDYISDYIKTSNSILDDKKRRSKPRESKRNKKIIGCGNEGRSKCRSECRSIDRSLANNSEDDSNGKNDNKRNTRPTQTKPTQKTSFTQTRPSTQKTSFTQTKPSTQTKPPTQNDINTNSTLYCNCGKVAVKSETKSGNNIGKLFYTCPEKDEKCGYFKWASEEGKCHCGFDPIELVSKTESNRGRRFLKCKKAYKPCKFFEWV